MFEQKITPARASSLRDPNSPRAKARSTMQMQDAAPQISEEDLRKQLRAAEVIGQIKSKHRKKEKRGPWGLFKRVFKFGGFVKLGVVLAIGGYFLTNPEAYAYVTDNIIGQRVLSMFDQLPDLAKQLKL